MQRWLVSAGALVTLHALPTAADAADVLSGGALDIKISPMVRTLATQGDRDILELDDSASTGLDFFTDVEVTVQAIGKHDATGIGYGGLIELEADTSSTANSDETFVFLQHEAWGRLELGDQDGVADSSSEAVSAETLAVGTGGLNADVLSDLFGVPTFEPVGTSDATKIVYKSPTSSPLRFNVSYTPNLATIGSGADNGDSLALTTVQAGNVAEMTLRYVLPPRAPSSSDDDPAKPEPLLDVALTGLEGEVKDKDAAGGDDFWAVQAGAVVTLGPFKLGGSYLMEEVGGLDLDAVTFGVATALPVWKQGGRKGAGGARVSLNYGQIIDADSLTRNGNELQEPYTVILSADYGIAPGLVLQGDAGYFDNDVRGEVVNADDEEGWLWVAGLALVF